MKPCPFCQHIPDPPEHSGGEWWVDCAYCGGRGPTPSDHNEAARLWNEQPSPFEFLPKPVLVMIVERFAAHCATEGDDEC